MNEANLITWRGRTLVAAHNYLSGGEFFKLEDGDVVAAVFADGSKKYYQVAERHIVVNVYDPAHWSRTFLEFTRWDRITLITCHPKQGNIDRYMIELAPIEISARDVARLRRENGMNQ